MSTFTSNGYFIDKNGTRIEVTDKFARDNITALTEEKLDKQQGADKAKTLLYVGDDGRVTAAELGTGLKTETMPGKNIFHGEWIPGARNSTTGAFIPAVSFRGNYAVNEIFPVEPNTIYTFSNAQPSVKGSKMYALEYNADMEVIKYHNGIGNDTINMIPATITTESDTRYITVWGYALDGVAAAFEDVIPADFMIEKGATATEYEPYRLSKAKIAIGDDIPLPAADDGIIAKEVPGKNIFPGNWSPGSWVTGVWTPYASDITSTLGIPTKIPVVPGGTYTISHAQLFPFFATMYLEEFDEHGNWLLRQNGVINFMSEYSKAVTVSERTAYIAGHIYTTERRNKSEFTPENFMIERGQFATTYEPYRVVKKLTLDPVPAYGKFVEAGLMPDCFEIPGYYHSNNYLDAKCSRIRELANGCVGDGDMFFFITDQHWEMNARQSPALIKYIAKKVHAPRLFSGGDTSEGIHETYANTMSDAFAGGIHHVMGNHDYFGTTGDELVRIFDMGKKEQIGNAKRHYYYVDNPQQAIRYIVLCAYSNESGELATAYDTEQINWLRDVALNVEEGWTVLVFTHSLYYGFGVNAAINPSPEGATTVIDVLDAATCDVACVIQGHTHLDRIVHTTGGIPVVLTTSDKYMPWMTGETNNEPWLSESRHVGTITEQAFDVVVLDKAARKLTFVRIGAPADNWTDGASTGMVEERVVTY